MEARIFYALAVNQTALASDKKYAQQLKAAAILEPLFKEHPKHPGLAHYIIHAYDHPPLAEKALAAARSYASLAPSVPHALHMPSHTFTRVGHVERVDRDEPAIGRGGAQGERDRRRAARDGLPDVCVSADRRRMPRRAAWPARHARPPRGSIRMRTGVARPASPACIAAAAIPARYALERGAWAEAAALRVRARPRSRTPKPSPISLAHSAPHDRAIPRPPPPTSSGSPRFATR